MKHLMKTSLLLLAFCLPLSAMAYDFEEDGVYYKTDLWGDFAMVCDQGEDGGRYTGNLTIPATVTNDDTTYPVTRINAYAFSNCAELTGVTIPGCVTEINDHSFENCTGLSSVELPEALIVIDAAAFEGCTAFTRIDIPAGVAKIGSGPSRTALTSPTCIATLPTRRRWISASMPWLMKMRTTHRAPCMCPQAPSTPIRRLDGIVISAKSSSCKLCLHA